MSRLEEIERDLLEAIDLVDKGDMYGAEDIVNDFFSNEDIDWLVNRVKELEKTGQELNHELFSARMERDNYENAFEESKKRIKEIENAALFTHNMQAERIRKLEREAEAGELAIQEYKNITVEAIESYEKAYDLNQRYKQALEYISEIKQPDGAYISRLDVAVTKARQALKGASE